AALPSTRAIEIDSCAPAHIDLSVFPSMSLASPQLRSFVSHLTRRYPWRLCLLCRFPQNLHSPDRDVSYAWDHLVPRLRDEGRSLIPLSSIETRSLPTLTRSYPRRFTFYVADPVQLQCISLAPARLDRYPRGFTGHVADAISSIVLIRGKEETFDRLGLNESVHNLCDVGDRDAPVKKMIGFD